MIKNLFSHNLLLKAISVLFAILLWILVNGEGDIQNTIKVPISISFPKGFRVTDQSAAEVNVGLLGTRVALLGANLNNIAMKPIDLSESKGGTATVIIKDENFENIPLGLEIVKIDPAKLIIELDRHVEKSLPVSLETTGKLPEGFILGGIKIDPSFVEVSGAAKQVSPLIRIYTEPIDLSGKTQNFIAEAIIDNPEPGSIAIDPSRVRAEIAIAEERIERSFDLPLMKPALGERWEWRSTAPSTVRLTLSGPYRALQRLQTKEIGPIALEIPASSLPSAGEGEVKIKARPVGLTGDWADRTDLKVVSISPEEVTLKLLGKPEPTAPNEAPDPAISEPRPGDGSSLPQP